MHAAHLGRLVQDLFELAMLDSSRVTPAFENFSLVELIYDVAQEFELEAGEANVALEVNRPEQDVTVYADISLIQRVLENLVGNALRYTPRDGKISISIQPSSAAVGVSVADTGPGIAEEVLPHIFDRFYQAEQKNERGNGAMGLGLAIAKRILELHESEIRVVSTDTSGARFDFELPMQAHAA